MIRENDYLSQDWAGSVIGKKEILSISEETGVFGHRL